MKKIIVVLLLLTFKFSFAQGGWFYQNPYPQYPAINSVKFLNTSTIFACGNNGSFLKSTNGGVNWSATYSYISSYPEVVYRDIHIFGNTIYLLKIVQYNFYSPQYIQLIKSSNAGANWDSLPVNNGAGLEKMNFLNINTGFCMGKYYYDSSKVLKTTNGGKSWNKIIANNDSLLRNAFFINENTGWVGNPYDNKYYKTSNGGITWNSFNIVNLYPAEKFYFINENTGWYNNSSTFFKTTNSGTNWTRMGSSKAYYPEFKFKDENTGWILNQGPMITTDGGLTWNDSNSQNYSSVDFLPDGTGISIGYGGISKTTNFGINWTSVYNSATSGGIELADVHFVNSQTGIVVGNWIITRTTDGGNTWQKKDSSDSFWSVKFFNETTGIVGGSGIRRTTDAGNTWSIALPGESGVFFNLSIINQITAIANGYYTNKIYKTTNAGLNWFVLTTIPNQYSICHFINSNTGFMMNEKMYRTSNAGASWVIVGNDQHYSRQPFYFINDNTGWFTDTQEIKKTTDGGLTWFEQTPNSLIRFYSFSFVNENTGWCVGGLNTGNIYKTTNGGTNWIENKDIPVPELSGVYFLNENTGWAVGDGGVIIKTTTGGGTISIQQTSTAIPDKFYLSQNYPNPFNPVTNIEFSLPQKSFVKLKVFDLLGREVANLVNENLSAGSYKYDFNASALTSGIYFYKLETDNFSETRKMVLIK